MSLGSNGVDWVRSLQKNPDVTSWHVLLHQWHQFTLFCTEFHELRNDAKCSQTLCNAPKHEFRVQWSGLGVLVEKKTPTWFCGTYFCINCTSTHCIALSFMQLRNDPKCTQTPCNEPKHEFRVQWGWLGVFVAKNPDVTSWHKLFH